MPSSRASSLRGLARRSSSRAFQVGAVDRERGVHPGRRTHPGTALCLVRRSADPTPDAWQRSSETSTAAGRRPRRWWWSCGPGSRAWRTNCWNVAGSMPGRPASSARAPSGAGENEGRPSSFVFPPAAPSSPGERAAHDLAKPRPGWRARERLLQPAERVGVAREARPHRRQPALPLHPLKVPQRSTPHGARSAVLDDVVRHQPMGRAHHRHCDGKQFAPTRVSALPRSRPECGHCRGSEFGPNPEVQPPANCTEVA
jgi:hypothetical protein